MNDPYAILEVKKNASQDEIKKSYRKLAKKYHPDLNPGNKDAEQKFKIISHANDLIGTLEERKKFDNGETDEQKHEEYEKYKSSQQNRNESFYSSQQNGGRYSHSFGNEDIDEDFIQNLFGSKKRGPTIRSVGEDVQYTLEVDFKEAALGGEKILTLPNGKKLQVIIPAGIETGKKLRFRGLGEEGIGGGGKGDAYVLITVKSLVGFHRAGKDVEYELPITFIEAILGAELRVPTIDGEVLLIIPPGVSTGSKLRIKGKGAGKSEERGNQIISLKIVTPKEISPELKLAVEQLKEHEQYNPREQI